MPVRDGEATVRRAVTSTLRAMPPDDPDGERVLRLVQLTVNGVAGGLQSTG